MTQVLFGKFCRKKMGKNKMQNCSEEKKFKKKNSGVANIEKKKYCKN